MSKHTPGPWQFDDDDNTIISDSRPGLAIASIDRIDRGGPKDYEFGDESIANARLILAAPALLATLKAMWDRWEPDMTEADRRMWEDASAAIAKAEGA